MTSFLLGLFVGLFLFIGYVAYRALRSGHWDSSNLLNVLRAISYFATHPDVFPYLIDSRLIRFDNFMGKTLKELRPFWYLPHDEFKDIVETA